MTILLDTNIIMGALQESSPFDAAAKEILLCGQSGKVKCVFTANAMSDFFICTVKCAAEKKQRSRSAF